MLPAPSPCHVPGEARPAPRQGLYRASVALAVAFCAVYGWISWPMCTAPGLPAVERALLTTKILMEMLFSFPAAAMLLVAVGYWWERPAPPGPRQIEGVAPPVAILYLCCRDLEEAAVRSLAALEYPGPLMLLIHDDAPGGDLRVDALVAKLGARARARIRILRRPEKTGGKPGAVNWVLEQTRGEYEHLLLCDNDSIVCDRTTLVRLVARMQAEPDLAAVQCRNVSVEDPDACAVNRVLARAIDVFHLFLTMASRHGFCPFVGHNALLRVRALGQVGGMTPGCFADDIDLTVRLNAAGWRVAYAEDLEFGEKHPPSYAAFRARTYKWSYGSMQVLKRHARDVLRSRVLTGAEKWGFFQFVGFYTLQTVLLVYVGLFYLLGPVVLSYADFDLTAAVLAGTVIPPLIFLPVISFGLRHGRWRELPALLLTCWLGYGATDFPTARGTLDALLGRPRSWVPTNTMAAGGLPPGMWLESLFGLLLLLLPLLCFPQLLLVPLTIVFAAKFLFIPTMALLYRDGLDWAPRRALRPRLRLLLWVLGLALALTAGAWAQSSAVSVHGREILVDGAPWQVRGVHYSPWRPGGGPGRTPYPTGAQLEQDLGMLRDLNANTLMVCDPTVELLDRCHAHRLRVVHGFWIEWLGFGTPAMDARKAEIVAAVGERKDHPALLGWMLGHEIPTWVVDQHGKATVERWLADLDQQVKARDARHFTTHGNWPNTRSLDLSFFDVAGFNLYALWPPEVVARGYAAFIRDVLVPIAGSRPLLITEYGANSLEAGESGQAELIRKSWHAILETGCAGGFAFAFADEWWKNYSNPKLPGAWWDRAEDLTDHLRHDQDPEEYYGLVTAERVAKPAFAVVAGLYSGTPAGFRPALALVGAIVVLAAASLIWAWLVHLRSRALPHPTDPVRSPAQPPS
jgi:cellulose synthase/poly-beta-1,6-N-acetylglucosamine synthase-like glycosyltransferase